MRIRNHKNARKFLAALRRSNKCWLPDTHWQTQWIFRGQSDARWDLTPSAWRPETRRSPLFRGCEQSVSTEDALRVRDEWITHLRSHLEQSPSESDVLRNWLHNIPQLKLDRVRELIIQKKFEFLTTRGFIEVANEVGLSVGDASFSVYAPVPRTYDPLAFENESNPFDPVVALAQHHGCPTRLLDWTHRPEIAACFAAENVENRDGDGALAIWALDLRHTAKSHLSVKPFSVPRSTVGYLHAQEGLFSYCHGADFTFVNAGNWPKTESICSACIVKLTLPWAEAGELERLLHAEGFHRAALMPTYDNVVATLKQQQQSRHKSD